MRLSTANQHIEFLQAMLIAGRNYVASLQKRLVFLNDGYSNKTENERNEIDILHYETCRLIVKNNRWLADLELDYKSSAAAFLDQIDEVDNSYNQVLRIAESMQETNFEIKHILYEANWKKINSCYVDRIDFYKKLSPAVQRPISETGEITWKNT